MTILSHAEKLAEQIVADFGAPGTKIDPEYMFGVVREAARMQIELAVKEEREACAQVADRLAREHGSEIGGGYIQRQRGLPEFEQSTRIAQAIRSRTASVPTDHPGDVP